MTKKTIIRFFGMALMLQAFWLVVLTIILIMTTVS